MTDPRDFLDDDRPPTSEPPLKHRMSRIPPVPMDMCGCIRFHHECLNKATQEDQLCDECRPQCPYSSMEGKCGNLCVRPRCNPETHGITVHEDTEGPNGGWNPNGEWARDTLRIPFPGQLGSPYRLPKHYRYEDDIKPEDA